MARTTIRPARSAEHEQISALALRSKGHWGYPPEFLEACRAELTFGASDCGSGLMWVTESGGRLTGFGLLRGEPPHGELAALFIDPSAIGTGEGRQLLLHLLRQASEHGFATLDLEADPGAASFYEHHGAVRVGSTPSGSIAGRVLPLLRFALGPSAAGSRAR